MYVPYFLLEVQWQTARPNIFLENFTSFLQIEVNFEVDLKQKSIFWKHPFAHMFTWSHQMLWKYKYSEL